METSSDKCLATGFTDEHLNRDFFSLIVGDRGRLTSWEELHLDTSTSILSTLATKDKKRKVGHFIFRINFENGKGPSSLDVVVKAKSPDVDIANVVGNVAQACGGDLAPVYEKYKMKDEFRCGDVREVELASLSDPVLRQYSPIIYHTINDPKNEIQVLVMEYLDSRNVTLMNTANDPWELADIKVVLRDLAKIHSSFLTKQEWLTSHHWLDIESTERMMRWLPLWKALVQHAEKTFPEMWTKDNCDIIRRAFDLIPSLWPILEQAPRTLVQNDCNPRNICLRIPTSDTKSLTTTSDEESFKKTGVPYSDDRCLCMYDWELAYAGAPQHDVVEFLSFALPSSTAHSVRKELIEFYRHHLEYYSGQEFPTEKFHEVYNICCLDFAMNRVSMYTMVHTPAQSYKFLPRVVENLFSHLTSEIATGGLKL